MIFTRCYKVVKSNQGVNLVRALTKQPDKDHAQLKLHSFSLTMDYDSIILLTGSFVSVIIESDVIASG